MFKKIAKTLFDEYLFNEEIYQGIKNSSRRPKFLHIGLKFWELIVQQSMAQETKSEARLQLLNALVNENFLRVLVRGLSI